MRQLITFILLVCPVLVAGQDRYLVDWNEDGEESNGHIIELVRINTSKLTGNETEAGNDRKGALAA